STTAQRPTLDDRDVAELSRAAIVPAIHPYIEDEPGPDAVRDVDIQRALLAASRAAVQFGESTQIGIVVDEDRLHQPPRHEVGDRQAVPAAQQSGARDAPVVRADRGG